MYSRYTHADGRDSNTICSVSKVWNQIGMGFGAVTEGVEQYLSAYRGLSSKWYSGLICSLASGRTKTSEVEHCSFVGRGGTLSEGVYGANLPVLLSTLAAGHCVVYNPPPPPTPPPLPSVIRTITRGGNDKLQTFSTKSCFRFVSYCLYGFVHQ